jgi:hypothetical protein
MKTLTENFLELRSTSVAGLEGQRSTRVLEMAKVVPSGSLCPMKSALAPAPASATGCPLTPNRPWDGSGAGGGIRSVEVLLHPSVGVAVDSKLQLPQLGFPAAAGQASVVPTHVFAQPVALHVTFALSCLQSTAQAAPQKPLMHETPQLTPLQVALPFAGTGQAVQEAVPQLAVLLFDTHAPLHL